MSGTVGEAFGIQSCSQAYVDLWENYGSNGNGLRVCYPTNIPNPATYGFNNITSSVVFNEITVNTTVCLYSEVNYIGEIWKATSDASAQVDLLTERLGEFRQVRLLTTARFKRSEKVAYDMTNSASERAGHSVSEASRIPGTAPRRASPLSIGVRAAADQRDLPQIPRSYLIQMSREVVTLTGASISGVEGSPVAITEIPDRGGADSLAGVSPHVHSNEPVRKVSAPLRENASPLTSGNRNRIVPVARSGA